MPMTLTVARIAKLRKVPQNKQGRTTELLLLFSSSVEINNISMRTIV